MNVFNCFAYCKYFPNYEKTNDKDKSKDHEKEHDIFIAAGAEKYLSIYNKSLEEMVVEFDSPDGVFIHSLIISRVMKLLFCGTSKGTIRIYPWPFIDEMFEWVPIGHNSVRYKLPDFYEIQIHSIPVCSLLISHDCKLMFAGTEDGSIITLKIMQSFAEGDLNPI